MKRLTQKDESGWYLTGDGIYSDWGVPEKFRGEDIDNLAAIEDILGDEYELDDVAPVRHGRWMEYDGADEGFHYCSECKAQAFNYEENGEVIEVLSEWCPHCGALMDRKENEQDD